MQTPQRNRDLGSKNLSRGGEERSKEARQQGARRYGRAKRAFGQGKWQRVTPAGEKGRDTAKRNRSRRRDDGRKRKIEEKLKAKIIFFYISLFSYLVLSERGKN